MARTVLHLELPGVYVAAARELGVVGADSPVVVYRDDRVLDLEGVDWLRRGLPLRQARRLAPAAEFVPVGVLAGAETYRAVWDALVPLGTAVEPTAWHGGYVDVTGCLPRRGVRAHLAALARRLEDLTRQPPAQGVAGNKLIARHASLWGRVVAPEEALGFLHGQRLRPERWLTREMIATLDELGCHVWGEVAQVPEPRLRALFGVRGTILNRWSEGVDPRPVQPRYPPPTETARVQLEPEQRTGWLAALEELSATLAERLRRRGETASEVVLALGLRQGAGVRRGSWQALRRRLARGVNQPEALRTIVLGLLPMDLEPQDLEEARLTLRGLRRHGAVQGVLFVEAHEERRHLLDSALARVRARWGLLGLGYAPEVVASRRRLAEAVWLLEEVG